MAVLVGIGAQKSGTTWLHACLRALPGVAFPFGKEAHAWDAGQDVTEEAAAAWARGLAQAGADGGLACDITPAYALLDEATIERVRAHAPEARLVMLLRDPIERAWSAARMELARDGRSGAEGSEDWLLDQVTSAGSLARGDYLATIGRWTRVFGPDRLLIDFHERISEDPRDVLRRILSHVGRDPAQAERVPEALLHRRVFAGMPLAMPAAVRDRLLDLYLPALERMAALPGWPAARWLASARREAA